MAKISRHGGPTNNPYNVTGGSTVDLPAFSYPIGVIPARSPVRPKVGAIRQMWVDYAVGIGLAFPKSVTKAQLITMFDHHGA